MKTILTIIFSAIVVIAVALAVIFASPKSENKTESERESVGVSSTPGDDYADDVFSDEETAATSIGATSKENAENTNESVSADALTVQTPTGETTTANVLTNGSGSDETTTAEETMSGSGGDETTSAEETTNGSGSNETTTAEETTNGSDTSETDENKGVSGEIDDNSYFIFYNNCDDWTNEPQSVKFGEEFFVMPPLAENFLYYTDENGNKYYKDTPYRYTVNSDLTLTAVYSESESIS